MQFCVKHLLLHSEFKPMRLVAQLVEHVTLNHGVEGSSPSEPTMVGIKVCSQKESANKRRALSV